MPETPSTSSHLWLSCGCGGNYTLLTEPKIGDEAWCYWHQWRATVSRFTAIHQRVVAAPVPVEAPNG